MFQDDEPVKYDDEGNRIGKKKKKKKKKKGKRKKDDLKDDNSGNLKDEELKLLLTRTSYTEKEIQAWHVNFREECPSGKLTKSHMQRLFKIVFPVGDSEHFCDWKINVEVQACNNEPKSERDITPPPTVPDFPSDIYWQLRLNVM